MKINILFRLGQKQFGKVMHPWKIGVGLLLSFLQNMELVLISERSVQLCIRVGRFGGKFEIIMWKAILFMYLTNIIRLQCFKTVKSSVMGHGFAAQIVRDGHISLLESKYVFNGCLVHGT